VLTTWFEVKAKRKQLKKKEKRLENRNNREKKSSFVLMKIGDFFKPFHLKNMRNSIISYGIFL